MRERTGGGVHGREVLRVHDLLPHTLGMMLCDVYVINTVKPFDL